MPSLSVGDLLDRARTFEYALEQYYVKLRGETEDEGVRIISCYLAAHRNHLSAALADFSVERIRRIRGVRLKYDVALRDEGITALLHTNPKAVTGALLLESAVAYNSALVALYRRVLEQPLSDDVREVIEALVRVEEREIVMFKKMAATNYF